MSLEKLIQDNTDAHAANTAALLKATEAWLAFTRANNADAGATAAATKPAATAPAKPATSKPAAAAKPEVPAKPDVVATNPDPTVEAGAVVEVTYADVAKAITAACAPTGMGGLEALKILESFGAKKGPELKPEQYPAVLAAFAAASAK